MRTASRFDCVFFALVTLAATSLAAASCKRDNTSSSSGADEKAPSRADFGEAIGAKVDAKPGVPAFEVAFAVTKGRDPMPLLGPLVAALSGAIGGCPAFVAEASKTTGVTAVQLSVDKGKAKLAPYADPTPGTQCLASKLEGKELAKADFLPVDARAELRFPPAENPTQTPPAGPPSAK